MTVGSPICASELPGIAPNLLTERLRSLQAIGLVAAVDLPPPAARSVYRLTDEGRRVEPVLRSVARFGARYLTGDPSEAFDAKRVAFALLAPWRRRPEVKIRARLIVTRDDDPTDTVDLVLDLAGMQIEAPEGKPDVTLRGGDHRSRGRPPDGRSARRPTHRRRLVAPCVPRSIRPAHGEAMSASVRSA